MSENGTYKVTVEGLGLSLERDVQKDIGDQILVLLLTGNPADSAAQQTRASTSDAQGSATSHQQGETPSGAPDKSIREFFDHCQAKRVPDKITATGVYLNDYKQQPDFKRNDLVNNFEAAAESVPKNLARDIKWALKAGWIAQRSGTKDAYYVTQSGRNAVERQFSREVINRTRGLVSGSKKAQPKSENNK